MWQWQSNKKAYEKAEPREIKKSFPLRMSLLKVWTLSWQETPWYPSCCMRFAFCMCSPLVSGSYCYIFSSSMQNRSNKNVLIKAKKKAETIVWALNCSASGVEGLKFSLQTTVPSCFIYAPCESTTFETTPIPLVFCCLVLSLNRDTVGQYTT